MAVSPMKVGVIGCGAISGAYFDAAKRFPVLQIAAAADLDMERAAAKAKDNNCRACTVAEILKDPEIKIILNLTIPKAHYEIAMKSLEAGKHVHAEKPLAVNREQGKKIVETAKAKNLRVGSAPDTFMGAGIQTCIKLIDDGWIGTPLGATAFMTCRGHESWHPDPEFYYEIGGGPVLDMGPYYLTALVAMLGPVKRTASFSKSSFEYRTITSAKKFGKKVKVEVPTHVAGSLDFANGVLGTIIMSFDVVGAQLPRIEIFGTEGTISVPDPNAFSGPIHVQRLGGERLQIPFSHIYAENNRGIGAADIAYAVQSGRPHRCSGEMAYHVLDVMQALNEGGTQTIASTCHRPAPLPMGLVSGQLDE
ncbi:MAG: Gfo/Idh/MocA family oxidoreductase [Planctomycetaceae bacterium]|nr:Gfo/Idh/MocA family oxidoreductase [Planctomycetaceae bacterium]